tara:strand:+ start:771 stop:992 length:222 start_codon:yes stop_codon:yes gene_type:complete
MIEEKKDSIVIRGFALLLGTGALVMIPIIIFKGEIHPFKGIICIPFAAACFMYGIGGSKLLRRMGVGSYVDRN